MSIARFALIINWLPIHWNFLLAPQSNDKFIYIHTSVSSIVFMLSFSFSGSYIGLLILFFRAWSISVLKCQNYDQILEGDDLTHMLFRSKWGCLPPPPLPSYCVTAIIWDFFITQNSQPETYYTYFLFLPKIKRKN